MHLHGLGVLLVKFRDIKEEVCREFSITLTDFDGPCRKPHLVQARQKAWWLARQKTTLSFPQIAKFSGGKNHSSVVYGVRVYEFQKTGVAHAWLAGRRKDATAAFEEKVS